MGRKHSSLGDSGGAPPSEAARRERGLVWHSTRHTFDSLTRGKIDGGRPMRIVGHSSERTNLVYTHALPEDLAAVRTVQESVFAVANEPKPVPQATGMTASVSLQKCKDITNPGTGSTALVALLVEATIYRREKPGMLPCGLWLFGSKPHVLVLPKGQPDKTFLFR